MACAPGTSGNGSVSCRACRPGAFAAGPGAASCAPCAVGTHSAAAGASICLSCADGAYAAGEHGRTSCVPCPAGTLLLPGTDECVEDIVRVEGSMAVPLNASMFERHKRTYIEGLANVSGVPPAAVQLTLVSPNTRRRLSAAGGVVVAFQITAAREAAGAASVRMRVQAALESWAAVARVPSPVMGFVGVTCGAGRAPGASACDLCVHGSFKSLPDNSSCLPCPLNTSAHAPTHCVQCQTNAMSAGGSSNCSCLPGFSGRVCAACAAGTYKPAPGGAACLPCTSGWRSNAGATACRLLLACPGPEWKYSMVSAASAALLVPNGDDSSDAFADSSDALEAFIAHYNRQGYGRPPKDKAALSCTDIYNQALRKLRKRTTDVSVGSVYSAANTLAARGLFAAAAAVVTLLGSVHI